MSSPLQAPLRLGAHFAEKDRFHDVSWKMGLVGTEGPFQAASAHFLLLSVRGQGSGSPVCVETRPLSVKLNP